MAPKGKTVNGLRIAQARLSLPDKPSQAEFAKRLDIHWVTQSNIENGKAKVSLELLEKIASETGVSREHLLALDADEDEESRAMPDHREVMEALHYSLGVALGKVPA